MASAIRRVFEDAGGPALCPTRRTRAGVEAAASPALVTTAAGRHAIGEAMAAIAASRATPAAPAVSAWPTPPPAWSTELRAPPQPVGVVAPVPVWQPRVTGIAAPVRLCPGWSFGSLGSLVGGAGGSGDAARTTHGERRAAQYPGVSWGSIGSVRACGRERALEMADAIRNDASRFALRPADSGMIEAMCLSLVEELEQSAPDSTMSGEAGHWGYWTAFCAELGTTPLRGDVAANSGIDPTGHSREITLMAAFIPWVFERMEGRRGFDEHGRRLPPLPGSVANVLRGVRRAHKRLGLPMASMSLAMRVCETLLNRYRDEHGPEALQPHRKEPLSNQQVAALVSLRQGTPVGSTRVDYSDLYWISLRAMYCTLAQTGFRKSEVCVPDGKPFGRRHLSRANLAWKIGGRFVRSPTPEQLRGLRAGDFAVLTVAPSKADQHGLHWGQAPVYLPFHGPAVIVNAARALRDLELEWPLEGLVRRDQPLFCDGARRPVRHSQADRRFREMLVAIGTPSDQLSKYSMHSWRIYLACALLAKGASHSQIMSMLRWRSDEALKIYARMNDFEYATWLDSAGDANISSIRAANLPPLISPEQAEETREWLGSVLGADVHAVPVARRPVADTDGVMGDLGAGMRTLMTAAATADDAADE